MPFTSISAGWIFTLMGLLDDGRPLNQGKSRIYDELMMKNLENIPVEQRRRTNPLAHVFDEFMAFCQSRSLFMLHYCTGCGAVELPPVMTSRFDGERLGISPMVSPRQADVLLVTGYVSVKTLKRVILTYEQMPAPKYVVGICSCTVNGGMYCCLLYTSDAADE